MKESKIYESCQIEGKNLIFVNDCQNNIVGFTYTTNLELAKSEICHI